MSCDSTNVRELEFGIPAGDKPHHEVNFRNMWNAPAIEAQEAGMLLPPPGTISTSTRPYPAELAKEGPPYAGSAKIGNPVPMTMKTLKQGKALYDTYCVVCHGEKGLGNGYIIGPEKYGQRPPSLASKKLRTYRDGQVYHIITNGQGSMGHYRSQVRPMERWAIVHYIRALQRAEYPVSSDVQRHKANTANTAKKATPSQ
jgi:hypothetical protein